MKGRFIRTFAFLGALALSGFAAQAIPAGWTYEGCWSPYPNCAGGKHVYRDAAGHFFECNSCSQAPSTTSCFQAGNLNAIGYWCS